MEAGKLANEFAILYKPFKLNAVSAIEAIPDRRAVNFINRATLFDDLSGRKVRENSGYLMSFNQSIRYAKCHQR